MIVRDDLPMRFLSRVTTSEHSGDLSLHSIVPLSGRYVTRGASLRSRSLGIRSTFDMDFVSDEQISIRIEDRLGHAR